MILSFFNLRRYDIKLSSLDFVGFCVSFLNLVSFETKSFIYSTLPTVPKKETILVLPYLGVRSKIVTKQLKTCINKFYGCIDLRVIFQSARRIKSFFPYKDMINRSQMSKVVYKASCWDCQDFYIGKTKRRLHDRKTEHFKGITSTFHASAIADHVTSTGYYG